jgi:hypothetical protein
MKDKRFLKVKKVSEERYFRDDRELIRFIEKQNGMSWDEMCDLCNRLSQTNMRVSARYWETHMNLDSDKLVIGKFIFHIFRGFYDRTSGEYRINILAVQRSDLMTGCDIDKVFDIDKVLKSVA